MSEPLIPLARAVAHEIGRLEAELDVELGAVHVDVEAGTVVIEGSGLKVWGPRTMLEGRLTKNGLRHETHMPDARVVVFPN